MTVATEQQLDDRDQAILAERAAALDEMSGPRVGDFVIFAEGVQRRISHIWTDDDDRPESIQTSDGGSYYLGHGYVSMSGSLHFGIPAATLTQTHEQRAGNVWFFHHDMWRAHNGVDAQIPFRVFTTPIPAAR